VSLRKNLEKFLADPYGLQRIVGNIIGFAAIIANLANTLVTIGSSATISINEIVDWYFISLSFIAICGIVSAYWVSTVSKWLQVIVFFFTAVLSGLTVRGGDLTSGFFIIFGLVLVFEYHFGRYAHWIGIVFAIVIYPLSLAIGFSKQSSVYLAQSAAVVLVIFCIIILYGSVLLRHELRHRQDKALLETRVKERTADLERALAERSVMLQEIHHRVNNNLQIISSILQLEANREESLMLRASREKSLQRIYAMALVHELLYQTDQLEYIELDRYAARLVDDFRSGSPVDFVVDAEEGILVGLDFAVPFGLLLNELVANARDHAFPVAPRGRVDVRVTKDEEGAVALRIADDGVGLPEELSLEGAKSLGFSLVNALAVQLHGKIGLDRSSGTAWTIVFPRLDKRSRDYPSGFLYPAGSASSS
jgi:two-component sensor histidine kinase